MKIIPTVYDLRLRGFKVTLTHKRVFFKYDPQTGRRREILASWHDYKEAFSDYFLSPVGGLTTVQIISPTGDVFEGQSTCSNKERFVRKIGIKKSIAKALKHVAA